MSYAEPIYPKMTMAQLVSVELIMVGIENDAGYLDNPACLYDTNTKSKLKEFFSVRRKKAQAVEFAVKEPETWEDVASKSLQLYHELEGIQDSADIGEHVQIIKAKAGLLERLNSVGDKALNHKQTAEFMAEVIKIMEDISTQEQRVLIMERVGEFK